MSTERVYYDTEEALNEIVYDIKELNKSVSVIYP